MKFLCVNCDEPMKFIGAEGPEEGSVSIIYSCPNCNNQVAMLTNPQETQLVRTLGVSIGGGAMPGEPLKLTKELMAGTPPSEGDEPVWTKDAEDRFNRIPAFIQPMVKRSILDYAKEKKLREITPEVMDAVRETMGM